MLKRRALFFSLLGGSKSLHLMKRRQITSVPPRKCRPLLPGAPGSQRLGSRQGDPETQPPPLAPQRQKLTSPGRLRSLTVLLLDTGTPSTAGRGFAVTLGLTSSQLFGERCPRHLQEQGSVLLGRES